MDSIVEIDAGEDRENVRLEERDHQFESGERNDEAERQQSAQLADGAQRAEHGDEAREHLQRDVAGQHVGEQTDAVGDRAREEGDDLDQHHQRQDHDRDAGGYEQFEEFQPVLVDAVEDDRQEHQQRQRESHDDVAGDGEGVGNDADDVRNEDEHEQREHQREELHAFGAGTGSDGVGDEFVAQLAHRLETPRDQLASGAHHRDADDRDREQHVAGGIGEGDLMIADMADREDLVEVELFDRID